MNEALEVERKQKEIKKCLKEANQFLHAARKYNNCRVPHDVTSNIAKDSKNTFLWKSIIGHRIQRGNLILNSKHGRKPAPLAKYENHFVGIMIKLSLCVHSIASDEGLSLIILLQKMLRLRLS